MVPCGIGAEMTLNPTAIRQLRRLLGLLEIHLSSGIESAIVPGTGDVMTGECDSKYDLTVAQDRRDLQKVYDWRKILAGNLPKTSPGRAIRNTAKPRKRAEAKP